MIVANYISYLTIGIHITTKFYTGKKFQDNIIVSYISKTSSIEGTQFDFKSTLLEMVEIKLAIIYPHNYTHMIA